MRRTIVPIALLLLGVLATACDNGAHVASTSVGPATDAPPSSPTEPPASIALTGIGDTIVITDEGFNPQWLVAPPGKVTFRNEGTRPWGIVFDHQPVRSGPIQPGETFVWDVPTPVSVTYHALDDPKVRGRITVQVT